MNEFIVRFIVPDTIDKWSLRSFIEHSANRWEFNWGVRCDADWVNGAQDSTVVLVEKQEDPKAIE